MKLGQTRLLIDASDKSVQNRCSIYLAEPLFSVETSFLLGTDAPSLVGIMQVLMDEMRAAFDAGDAAAVDRIYNRMVGQMAAGAMSQAA